MNAQIQVGTKSFSVCGQFTIAVNTAPGYGYQVHCHPSDTSPNGNPYYSEPSSISVSPLSPGASINIGQFRCYESIPAPFVGCPYVSYWDGTEYVSQNSILPASEDTIRPTLEVSDNFVLSRSIEPVEEQYSLLINEYEYDVSNLDCFRLLTIDHDREGQLAISPSGELYSYVNPQPAVACDDANGDSHLINISYCDDGVSYNGTDGKQLEIQFDVTEHSEGRLLIRSDKAPPPHQPHTPLYYDGMLYGPIVVEIDDGGGWIDIAEINPRALWDMDVIDVSQYICEVEFLSVRLTWEGFHPLDYVGIDFTPQVGDFDIQEYFLDSAYHSGEGDVTNALSYNDDLKVTLIQNQSIELKFPYEASETQYRDVILMSWGHYDNPYRIIKGIDICPEFKSILKMTGDEGAFIDFTLMEGGCPTSIDTLEMRSEPQAELYKSFFCSYDKEYEIILDYQASSSDLMNEAVLFIFGPSGYKQYIFEFNAQEGEYQQEQISISLEELSEISEPDSNIIVRAESSVYLDIIDFNTRFKHDWEWIIWDFGDTYRINTTETAVLHDYSEPGEYTIEVTLAYGVGESITLTRSIVVIEENNVPVAEIDIYQQVKVSLRTAGRKGNYVTAQIIEDGSVIQGYSVERIPGNPDAQTQSFTMKLKAGSNYEVKLIYDAAFNGENPVWLKFESNSVIREYYTLFETINGYYQELTVDECYYCSPVEIYCPESTIISVENEVVYGPALGDGSDPMIYYLEHYPVIDCSFYLELDDGFGGRGIYKMIEGSDYYIDYETGMIDTSIVGSPWENDVYFAFYNYTGVIAPVEAPLDVHSIVFDATGSYDIGGTIESYEWDFGDGSIGYGEVVEHTFTVAGLYEIELVLTDDLGAVTRETYAIIVDPSDIPDVV